MVWAHIHGGTVNLMHSLLMPSILGGGEKTEYTLEGEIPVLGSFAAYLNEKVTESGYDLTSQMRNGSLVVSVPKSEQIRKDLDNLWSIYQKAAEEGYVKDIN